ncbi:uncharacterized protein DS421_2g48880 [Arachis hypogaea]|nr:uncharacterized protein DS421_2g48880 [Arachis hypogaea]
MDEADEAWLVYFGRGDCEHGKWRLDNDLAPEPVAMDDYHVSQMVALRALHKRYVQPQGTPAATTNEMVPKKPDREPLLAVSMRDWVRKACDSLDIPPPIYRIIRQTTSHDRRCYRHLASVVPSRATDALVVYGRYAYDIDTSLEDAARLFLRALSEVLDTFVDDYNYDLLETWKTKYINLAQELCSLQSRLNDVPDTKDALHECIFDLEQL